MDDLETTLKRFEQSLSKQQVGRAIVRGLNKAGVGIRAKAVQLVREDINIRAADLKNSVTISRAKISEDISVTLTARGDPIRLIKFVTVASLRQVKAGDKDKKGNPRPLRIKVSRKQPARVLKSGFYVPAYNKIMKRKTKKRHPIRQMYGPSLAKQVEDRLKELEDFAAETVAKRIEESLAFEISKAMK